MKKNLLLQRYGPSNEVWLRECEVKVIKLPFQLFFHHFHIFQNIHRKQTHGLHSGFYGWFG